MVIWGLQWYLRRGSAVYDRSSCISMEQLVFGLRHIADFTLRQTRIFAAPFFYEVLDN